MVSIIGQDGIQNRHKMSDARDANLEKSRNFDKVSFEIYSKK